MSIDEEMTPDERDGVLDGMTTLVPDSKRSERERHKRQMAKLLDWLHLQDSDFARSLGIDRSIISRVKAGERRLSAESITKIEEKYRIRRRYWKTDAAPAAMLQPRESAGDMDFQVELARYSARRNDPPAVSQELLRLEAPVGATFLWWVDQYLALLARHGPRA